MNALVISIGNELLNGKTTNSNAAYIGRQLADLGIALGQIITIRDEAPHIEAALKLGMSNYDAVIVTGGLGPTHDDITRKTVASFLNTELVLNEAALAKIEGLFQARGREMPPINRQQALVPKTASLLENPLGTAPGLHIEEQDTHIFLLPGVPREMQEILTSSVLPILSKHLEQSPPNIHLYRTTGIFESKLYEICLTHFEQFPQYEIAFLPKFTGVDIRVAERGPAEMYREFESGLINIAGKYIYSQEDEEIEAVVGRMLAEKGLTLSLAESCTGGLLSHRLTNIPGSSAYYLGGVNAYSNDVKMDLLGVSAASLEAHGAVSEVVAGEMAAGIRQRIGSSIGISTTGIAGPGGATDTKPVGLVCIGFATESSLKTRQFTFGKDRKLNKDWSAQAAIEMLRRYLRGL